MSKFVQLYELANKNGTDKGHLGPSKKWSANNYTDVYQAYLGSIKDSVENFCEIGLGVPGPNWESTIAHGNNPVGGGSIRMWQEFFPNAHIDGLDINPASHLDNDQIKTHLVDQSSKQSLEQFKADTKGRLYDVIIDDGSHIADHQQITLSLLWEKVVPGGYYIIEDLNDLRPHLNKNSTAKHAPENSESTRVVFQEFLETGKITSANNFENMNFLEEIDYLAFHAFPCMQGLRDIVLETIRILVGRGGKGLLRHEFRTSAPKIVVLRKKK